MEQARQAFQQNVGNFKHTLHARLSSRTALALGFAGGLLLGRRYRTTRSAKTGKRGQAAAQRVKQSLPPHWLGGYLIWPFVLATARDFVVTHRPGRREA